MEATRMRASLRASTTVRKKEEKKEKRKEGVSSSAPKVVENGAPKRKTDGKDDCPFKKASVNPGEKHPKKPSPPEPNQEASKGLMTSSGPVTQGTRHLLMHKGYVVEMVESIIRGTDLDPCAV